MLFWKKKESTNKKTEETEKINTVENPTNELETEKFVQENQEDDFIESNAKVSPAEEEFLNSSEIKVEQEEGVIELNAEDSKVEEEFLIPLNMEPTQEEGVIELNAEDSKVEEEVLNPLEMEQKNPMFFDETSKKPIHLEQNQEIVTLISEIEKEVPESIFSVETEIKHIETNEEQYEIYRSKLKDMFAKHSK